MRVFSEKYAEVMYHPILKAVIVKWKDFATHEEYQKTIECAYEEAAKRKCTKWISDMTKGKAVSMSSSRWLKEEFIPKIEKDKVLKKMAFLIDYNPLRKLFIDSIRENIHHTGISFKCFKSQQEMERWILDMENLPIIEDRVFIQYY